MFILQKEGTEMITLDIETLRTENDELRRLLAKHQWSGLRPWKSSGVCPECSGSSRSGGHRPGCAIAEALAQPD
jgi:hypothetical protein